MPPREAMLARVDALNRADVDALAALYHAEPSAIR
jgi:hypothetical protein